MNVLKNRKKEAEKKTKKDPKKKEKKNQDDDEDDGIKIKAATKVKEVEEEDKVVENTEEKAIG